MISSFSPRLRLYLRVVAFGGLLGIVEGVAEAIIKHRSLSDIVDIGEVGIGIVQSYASQSIFFIGITYGIIAIIVTMMFDYEPNPRRFKRVMALAMLPLALILTFSGVQSALRYPSSYDASDFLYWITHVAGVLWTSQYIARNYLRELANSNQEKKRA